MRNQVQLIVYADRLGGSLRGLAEVLAGPLAGLFGGVHVLPFYTPYDGVDAGFDPVDHLSVDTRLGSWDDLRQLGRVSQPSGGADDARLEIVADLIVNHASDRSPQFRDVLANGTSSPFARMFLTYGKVFAGGAAEADLLRVVRPRPGLPFTPVLLGGRPRLAWTTFTGGQIDLDVADPTARAYLTSVLRKLSAAGVTIVRLDAVGYAVKTAGTSCFMTPRTLDFIDAIATEAHALGMQVLTEVHAHHRYAAEAARHADRVYDFVLAPLVLHALFTGDVEPLLTWLGRRPANTVTVLVTHDGIGMVDAGPGRDGDSGLLSPAQIDTLVQRIAVNSRGTSRSSVARGIAGAGVYQVSCTLYDALGADERLLLARALQFFTPGIPQVFYVGLLAGRNDPAATGDPREINRRRYATAELKVALEQPVVRALDRLIRFRNAHPAFGGTCSLHAEEPGEMVLSWRSGADLAELWVNPGKAAYRITFSSAGGEPVTVEDAADLPGQGFRSRAAAKEPSM
jgi:sucrose phosphorylase